MPKTSKQIVGEIDRVESVSRLLGVELQQIYRQYYRSFAVAVRQQAIQAGYYICTQPYAAEFLDLSVPARSQLIKAMQRSIRNSLDHLEEVIAPPPEKSADGRIESSEQNDFIGFDSPEHLDRWQQQIERAIRLTLRGISHKSNLLLIQAGVLPADLPRPILEASTTADRRGDRVHNVPNIVSALMETGRDRDDDEDDEDDDDEDDDDENEDDDDDDDDDREMMMGAALPSSLSSLDLAFPNIVQIYAILMRRTEVEISDLTLMGNRQQIDRLAAKIKKLKREYRQLRSQLTTTNAAIAWQASWRDWDN